MSQVLRQELASSNQKPRLAAKQPPKPRHRAQAQSSGAAQKADAHDCQLEGQELPHKRCTTSSKV
eukprot:1650760-Amphidinium_carterae.3